MENFPERFAIGIEVQPEDIDMLGHVNNVVYLRWVQDAAVAHWNAIAPEEDREKLLWVVRSHEISYRRPAFSGETIRAETWIGSASRYAFDRHTEIINAENGKMLALARTVWCPLDRKTGRPGEVSPAVRALFSTLPPEPSTEPLPTDGQR